MVAHTERIVHTDHKFEEKEDELKQWSSYNKY